MGIARSSPASTPTTAEMAIVGMPSALGVPVIPEGIETEEQLTRLIDLRCRFGQSFLFSRPVGATEIEEMLTAGMTVA